MEFVSLRYFLTLALFLLISPIFPHLPRRFLIVAFGMGLFLYSSPLLGGVFLASAILDYLFAPVIKGKGRLGSVLLWLTVGGNVLLLVAFRYLCGMFPSVEGETIWKVFLLPLGLSYIVFKRISYLLDVRRGTFAQQHDLLDYLQYVFFFGDMFAGPINRAEEMINQFRTGGTQKAAEVLAGLRLFLWGLFKKLVVADRTAALADAVFSGEGAFPGIQVLLATLLFSVQIYADFSGYTDMALGLARVAGFRMRINFDLPYGAVSIKEFWQRWHISLSLWLRDYLFLPLAMKSSRLVHKDVLAGVRNENWAYGVASFFTMSICGLWHGSTWTFLIWGSAHGIWLVVSHLSRRLRKKVRKRWIGRKWAIGYSLLRRIFTFSLLSFLWIFFRSETLGNALSFIASLFQFSSFWTMRQSPPTLQNGWLMGQTPEFWLITLLAMLFMFAMEYSNRKRYRKEQDVLPFDGRPYVWPLWIMIVLAVLNLGLDTPYRFIYTQF